MNDTTFALLTPTPENPEGDDIENACADGACALPPQPQSGGSPSIANPAMTTEIERTP